MSTGPKKQAASKIVGLRMTPIMAKQFKTEAAKRGISLRRLFDEMWATYQATQGKERQ